VNENRVIRIQFVVLVLLASCAIPPSPPRETIKIVSLLPRTGSAKQQTDFIVNAINLALDECGREVAGFRLTYADLDTTCAWEDRGATLRDSADFAAQDPDVMVVIGTYNSGAARVVLPMFNQLNLLMISSANTWPGLTKPGKGDPGEPEKYRPTGKINYVRVVAADDIQGPKGAEWAMRAGLVSVFILDDGEIYGKGIADGFRSRATELGFKVLGQETIDFQKDDFKPVILKIKGLSPDLVYFGGTTQTKAGEIARDLVAEGLRCKLMVPDGCFEDRFIANAGAENLNDRCFLTFGNVPPEKLTTKAADFASNYKKRFAQDPEFHAVYAYEATKVAIEAIRRAGKKDRDAIRSACLSIRDFDGALGRWSFDENGDTTFRTISIYAVRSGKFEFIELMK